MKKFLLLLVLVVAADNNAQEPDSLLRHKIIELNSLVDSLSGYIAKLDSQLNRLKKIIETDSVKNNDLVELILSDQDESIPEDQ